MTDKTKITHLSWDEAFKDIGIENPDKNNISKEVDGVKTSTPGKVNKAMTSVPQIKGSSGEVGENIDGHEHRAPTREDNLEKKVKVLEKVEEKPKKKKGWGLGLPKLFGKNKKEVEGAEEISEQENIVSKFIDEYTEYSEGSAITYSKLYNTYLKYIESSEDLADKKMGKGSFNNFVKSLGYQGEKVQERFRFINLKLKSEGLDRLEKLTEEGITEVESLNDLEETVLEKIVNPLNLECIEDASDYPVQKLLSYDPEILKSQLSSSFLKVKLKILKERYNLYILRRKGIEAKIAERAYKIRTLEDGEEKKKAGTEFLSFSTQSQKLGPKIKLFRDAIGVVKKDLLVCSDLDIPEESKASLEDFYKKSSKVYLDRLVEKVTYEVSSEKDDYSLWHDNEISKYNILLEEKILKKAQKLILKVLSSDLTDEEKNEKLEKYLKIYEAQRVIKQKEFKEKEPIFSRDELAIIINKVSNGKKVLLDESDDDLKNLIAIFKLFKKEFQKSQKVDNAGDEYIMKSDELIEENPVLKNIGNFRERITEVLGGILDNEKTKGKTTSKIVDEIWGDWGNGVLLKEYSPSKLNFDEFKKDLDPKYKSALTNFITEARKKYNVFKNKFNDFDLISLEVIETRLKSSLEKIYEDEKERATWMNHFKVAVKSKKYVELVKTSVVDQTTLEHSAESDVIDLGIKERESIEVSFKEALLAYESYVRRRKAVEVEARFLGEEIEELEVFKVNETITEIGLKRLKEKQEILEEKLREFAKTNLEEVSLKFIFTNNEVFSMDERIENIFMFEQEASKLEAVYDIDSTSKNLLLLQMKRKELSDVKSEKTDWMNKLLSERSSNDSMVNLKSLRDAEWDDSNHIDLIYYVEPRDDIISFEEKKYINKSEEWRCELQKLLFGEDSIPNEKWKISFNRNTKELMAMGGGEKIKAKKRGKDLVFETQDGEILRLKDQVLIDLFKRWDWKFEDLEESIMEERMKSEREISEKLKKIQDNLEIGNYTAPQSWSHFYPGEFDTSFTTPEGVNDEVYFENKIFMPKDLDGKKLSEIIEADPNIEWKGLMVKGNGRREDRFSPAVDLSGMKIKNFGENNFVEFINPASKGEGTYSHLTQNNIPNEALVLVSRIMHEYKMFGFERQNVLIDHEKSLEEDKKNIWSKDAPFMWKDRKISSAKYEDENGNEWLLQIMAKEENGKLIFESNKIKVRESIILKNITL